MAGRALFLQIIEGKAPAHFIMDDPAGNSYLQVQPWVLGVGSLSNLEGFISLARVGSGVPIGALGVSRLLKPLLALWVLSWDGAQSPQAVLGPDLWAEGVQELSPVPTERVRPRGGP